MSKAGNNYYYLQDELGSPMYMTGTDGVAVSSYAFDDFGRNVDPFTGKIKETSHKHGYTTDGNIIQPFAFTGYQEDEVSGLKFAQARFYDANNGRFQSEDNVKGFVHSPFMMNRYGYCFNNPLGLVDRDGNWPDWVTSAYKTTTEFWDDYGGHIVNAATTGLALAGMFAVGGPVGLAVGASALLVSGAVGGVSAHMNGEDVASGVLGGLEVVGTALSTSVGLASALYTPTNENPNSGAISKYGKYVNNEGGCPYQNENVSNEAHNVVNYMKLKEQYRVTEAANDVVDSLNSTRKLPDYYITKSEARELGWSEGKALANYAPGKAIGGDVFKNSSGVVPQAQGRVWHEADVGLDYTMSRANSHNPSYRILYSNDGMVYGTYNHYEDVFPIIQ